MAESTGATALRASNFRPNTLIPGTFTYLCQGTALGPAGFEGQQAVFSADEYGRVREHWANVGNSEAFVWVKGSGFASLRFENWNREYIVNEKE